LSFNNDLLVVENLKTWFLLRSGAVKAVDGVTMKLHGKERVGLVGESSCGKSTIALAIMRLVPSPGEIIEGQIYFKGKNLVESSEEEMMGLRGKEIAMIFQDPMTYLNPVMRIKDQIAEAIVAHRKVQKEEVTKMVIEILERVRIPDPLKVMNYYPHQLSGGMLQRCMIAMALSCEPSILIADEPTTALDVTIQLQILDLLKKVSEELGMSLLLVTHDLGIVAEICDRVYVMYAGRIVEQADIFTLYRRPGHPYTQALFQCALSVDELKSELVSIEGIVPDGIHLPSGCRFHPRCSKCMPICRQREPVVREIENGHEVACWLYT